MDKFSSSDSTPDRRTPAPGSVPARRPGPEPGWGPAPWLSSVALLLMLAALAWRLIDHDPENRLVAAVLVAVFALTALTLVRIRVRLRADADGVAVTGPLRTRRIPWSAIDTISAPQRGRFGRRSPVLELEVRPGDADGPADDELLTFGRFELGADPAAVGRELLRGKRAAGS